MNISSEDVAKILRRWIRGEITAHVIGETWDEMYAGDVRFKLSNGMEIVIFNDCDSMDYIDHVEASGHTIWDWNTWRTDPVPDNEWFHPCDRLNDEDRAALEKVLKSIRAEGLKSGGFTDPD